MPGAELRGEQWSALDRWQLDTFACGGADGDVVARVRMTRDADARVVGEHTLESLALDITDLAPFGRQTLTRANHPQAGCHEGHRLCPRERPHAHRDRGHAVEVARAMIALEAEGRATDAHARGEAVAIHLGRDRRDPAAVRFDGSR